MNQIPLAVALDRDKTIPTSFCRGGRTYRVTEVQDCWRLVGNWWAGQGETTFFRVQIVGGGIFELAYDHAKSIWRLHRIED